jgi:hypothetical protein
MAKMTGSIKKMFLYKVQNKNINENFDFRTFGTGLLHLPVAKMRTERFRQN